MTSFERLFFVMTRPWVLALGVLFIVCAYFFVDIPTAVALRETNLLFKWPWLSRLTNLGLGLIYVIVLIVAAFSCRFFFHSRRWEIRIWFLWLCVAVPSLICLVLKTALGRARPDLYFFDHLYGFYGPHKKALYLSFPSGHTTTIMGLMFGLSALFPRYCLGLVLFGLLIAASRVLLVLHYVSDVFTAAYLALIEVGVLYSIVKPSWLEPLASCQVMNHRITTDETHLV